MNNDRSEIERLNLRIAAFRRALVKGWGRKPNAVESAAIARAASLSARAEISLRDPNCTENDIVRIDRLASIARRDLVRIREAGREKDKPMTLGDLLKADIEGRLDA